MKARVPPPSPDDYVRDLPRDLVALCRALLESRSGDACRRSGRPRRRGTSCCRCARRRQFVAPFVGRRRERDRLAPCVRSSADRECKVALIIGQSGVGKTALARQIPRRSRAAELMVLLESRCDERETVPFNAFDGIVDGWRVSSHIIQSDCPRPRSTALRTSDAAELRRLFPCSPSSRRRDDVQLSLDDSRAAATRALRDVLVAIGRGQPLALLIDDAQWADADSCALLADLLASPPPPLLLVVTARGPEAPAAAWQGIHVDEEVIARRSRC